MSEETFKGGVHFVTGGIAVAMLLYNTMQLAETGDKRNLLNVVIYGLVVPFEAAQALHHWRRV